MKINSAVKLGTVATFAAVLLAACGSNSSSSTASKQTLNWMESSALPSMDASTATDVVSGETINNTGEGLLRIGKNSKTYPGVAKSYKVSRMGKLTPSIYGSLSGVTGTKLQLKISFMPGNGQLIPRLLHNTLTCMRQWRTLTPSSIRRRLFRH